MVFNLFKFLYTTVDDICAGDKCPEGQQCVLTDNGNQHECVEGNVAHLINN